MRETPQGTMEPGRTGPPTRRAVANPSPGPGPPSAGAGRPYPRSGPGPPSQGGPASRRYTRPSGGAPASSVPPEASSLNPKFFRNGIVMIVLVLGTAALLFTWITTSTP